MARRRRAGPLSCRSRKAGGRAVGGEPIGLADDEHPHDRLYLDRGSYSPPDRPVAGGPERRRHCARVRPWRLALRRPRQGPSPGPGPWTRGQARANCGAAPGEAASGRDRRFAARCEVACGREGPIEGGDVGGLGGCAARADGHHPVRKVRPVPLALRLLRRGELRFVRTSGDARRLLRGPCRRRLSEAALFGREPDENGRR